MADRKRFKQHRDFKDRLEENPEERIRRADRRNAEDAFEKKGRRWRDEDERGERRGEKRFDKRSERRDERRSGNRQESRGHDREKKGSWKEDRRGGNNPFARKGDKNRFDRK